MSEQGSQNVTLTFSEVSFFSLSNIHLQLDSIETRSEYCRRVPIFIFFWVIFSLASKLENSLKFIRGGTSPSEPYGCQNRLGS